MKTAAVLLGSLCLLPCSSMANGLCQSNSAFVNVPDRDPLLQPPPSSAWTTRDLPRELAAALRRLEWGASGYEPPEEISGFRLDMNGDGRDEYFLVNPAWSGSGGESYVIMSRLGDKWVQIGDGQGVPIVLTTGERYQGKLWRDYVQFSRFGGDMYLKATYSFVNGQYKAVKGMKCVAGVIE